METSEKQFGLDLAVGFAILLIILAVAIPVYRHPRTVSSQSQCINNLRQIDSGKEQWALANNKSNGEVVVISEVNMYIKGNTTPECPKGGVYTYNVIGSNPTCNITSPTLHRMP